MTLANGSGSDYLQLVVVDSDDRIVRHQARTEGGKGDLNGTSRFDGIRAVYLHDVQRFLDHADISTTSRYLQASRFALHSAMRRMEADRQRAAKSASADTDQQAANTIPSNEGRPQTSTTVN